MRYLKWLITAAALAGLLAALSHYSKQPLSLPEGSVSASWLQSGFYDVGSFHVNEHDDSRTVTATKQAPISRRFVGKLWFPMIEDGLVAPGKHPLIIYLHRFGGSHTEFSRQAKHLASKGYLVLAVNSPTAQTAETLPKFAAQLADYAQDIGFLLDTLSRWNTSPETLFYSRIDINRIGLVGRSLGGTAALVSSFHPRLADRRISLIATLGGLSAPFTETFFKHRPELPLLAIAGTADTIANYPANALALLNKHHNTWLVSINNGNHHGFSENPKRPSWLRKTEALRCDSLAPVTANAAWAALGSGHIDTPASTACNADTPPGPINPVEQTQLSQLALIAFIEMHFADTAFERNAASDFLSKTISVENPMLQYVAPVE